MNDVIECKPCSVGKDELQHIRHSHNDCEEILFTENGNGVFILEDRILPLSDRCIYFIKNNTFHCSAPVHPDEYVRSVVLIKSNFWSKLGELSGYDEVFSNLTKRGCISLDPTAAKKIKKAIDEFAHNDRRKNISALFSIMDIAEGQDISKNIPDTTVAAIISHINQNLTEQLTLDSIASSVFMSKYYMCHLFKSTTGMSISRYIILRRLSLCKGMLIHTDRSVSEICTECGFSSFSYFSRAFHKNEGMSASEYRKSFQNR